jgi:hypothetical protein
MADRPGEALRSRFGMKGILTMPPERGGITELLCDMDDCYRPRGRFDFERIPDPIPKPIPEWIPTEDHFPKTQEVGGQKRPGNVRLAHRRCNMAASGVRRGAPQEAQRARAEKEEWHRDHPKESAANAETYADAEERWAAMRRATDVVNLEEVSAHFDDIDTARLATGLWLHVWRIRTADVEFVYLGATQPSPNPETTSLPFERSGQKLALRPGPRAEWLGGRLQAAGIDITICTPETAIAIGPISPVNAKIEAVETALAGHLWSLGYRVLNEERAPNVFDRGLFGRVCELIDAALPQRPIVNPPRGAWA